MGQSKREGPMGRDFKGLAAETGAKTWDSWEWAGKTGRDPGQECRVDQMTDKHRAAAASMNLV